MNNKNEEKNTHPTNNYRKWLIGILIGLIIILIGWLIFGHIQSKRNAEAEKFNSTHFNSNVVIYDIPVGKLTVKKATAKINEKAKNDAILEGDKVVLKKTGNKVITSKKVQSYFETQHTRYPSRKKWNFQNDTLLKAKDKFTSYTKIFDFSELNKTNVFALQVETWSVYYDLTLSYYIPSKDVLERDEWFSIKRTYYDYQDYLKIQTLKSQEYEKYRKGKISYTDLKYPQNIIEYIDPVQQVKVWQLLVSDNQIIVSETRDQVVFEWFLPAGVDAVNTSLATSQKLNIQNSSENSNKYGYGYDNSDWWYIDQNQWNVFVEENSLNRNWFIQINEDWNLFERVEFRTDRVMAYTEKFEPWVHHFMYVIRAWYVGEFGINPTMISQMYTPEVFGRTAWQLFKID